MSLPLLFELSLNLCVFFLELFFALFKSQLLPFGQLELLFPFVFLDFLPFGIHAFEALLLLDSQLALGFQLLLHLLECLRFLLAGRLQLLLQSLLLLALSFFHHLEFGLLGCFDYCHVLLGLLTLSLTNCVRQFSFEILLKLDALLLLLLLEFGNLLLLPLGVLNQLVQFLGLLLLGQLCLLKLECFLLLCKR